MSLHAPLVAASAIEHGPIPAWSPARKPARLTALEWSVVAMAEQDEVESLREPGRLASAFGKLFGRSRANSPMQSRLEALRRVAVHAWRSPWLVPGAEVRAFLAAGFTLEQYEVVQASISKGRASRHRREVGR